MPKIDGISLLGIIRPKHRVLPIVMFTGLGRDEQAMAAAKEAGADDYVAKGLGPSQVYAVLSRIVTVRQQAAA